MNSMEESHDFLFTFAFGHSSALELQCLLALYRMGKIEYFDQSVALVKCTEKNALQIISRAGGINKAARVLPGNLEDSISQLYLPERQKFNWTVAAYGCDWETLTQARQEIHLALKESGLGKSKFLEPIERASLGKKKPAIEIDVRDLKQKILTEKDGTPGFELIVFSLESSPSKTMFAQTIETIDVEGYEARDFGRPFQDPTKTVSPRFGRVLVNLGVKTRSRVLDPFCGLGTTLGEALMVGYDVVGTDRNAQNISQTRANLQWIASKYAIRGQNVNLFAFDARRISKASMPRVHAVATEPILLPIYRRNPSAQEAIEDLVHARETYERCLPEFAAVLQEKGSRIAFTTPSIFDSSGRERSFSLDDAAREAGFKPYYGGLPGSRLNYPLKIELSKKRIVHRNLNVYELA